MHIATLRPGFLIHLTTTVTGGVKYTKQVIESAHTTLEGLEKARWETERTVYNRAEHDRAIKAQGAARGALSRVCIHSSKFGLLCPDDRAAELEAAMNEARTIADDFNATATHTRLSVYILPGRIAPNDQQATHAITAEVKDLIDRMVEGVKNLDPVAIREAANEARGLNQMLTAEIAEQVQGAIDSARSAARKIVAEKGAAAIEADKIALQRQALSIFATKDESTGEMDLNLDAIEAVLKAKVAQQSA